MSTTTFTKAQALTCKPKIGSSHKNQRWGSARSLIFFAGCREEPKNGFERYIPAVRAARRAGVVRVMEGWLKGLSPEASGSLKPEIHVVDQTRRADQHLAGYEIVGEVPAENARAFAVRVRYNGADETGNRAVPRRRRRPDVDLPAGGLREHLDAPR